MPNETYALFDTTEGQFKAKLFNDKAPRTVENFVGLADGSKTGKPFYDGTVFHRVIPNFMIQGGDPPGSIIVTLMPSGFTSAFSTSENPSTANFAV